MEQRDYDSRTALHVAAAEGNVSLCVTCCLIFHIYVDACKHIHTPNSVLQDMWMSLSSCWRPAK